MRMTIEHRGPYKQRRQREATCEVCGKPFMTRANNLVMLCSDACRTTRAEFYKYERSCRVCGKTFAALGNKILCSEKCRQERQYQLHPRIPSPMVTPAGAKLPNSNSRANEVAAAWIAENSVIRFEKSNSKYYIGPPEPSPNRGKVIAMNIAYDRTGNNYRVRKSLWLDDTWLSKNATVRLNPNFIHTKALLKVKWIK